VGAVIEAVQSVPPRVAEVTTTEPTGERLELTTLKVQMTLVSPPEIVTEAVIAPLGATELGVMVIGESEIPPEPVLAAVFTFRLLPPPLPAQF
jgi:hypothetical protein